MREHAGAGVDQWPAGLADGAADGAVLCLFLTGCFEDEAEITPEEVTAMLAAVRDEAAGSRVAVVSDYGYGAATRPVVGRCRPC